MRTRSATADLEWRASSNQAMTLEWSTFQGEDIGVPGTGGVFTGVYPETDRSKIALGYEGRELTSWLARLDARIYGQKQEETFATVLDLPPIPAGPFDLLIDTTTERLGDVRTAGLDDLVVVHTCAVTAEAERQARQAIRRAGAISRLRG